MSTKVKPPRWVVGSAIIGVALHFTAAADFFESFDAAPSEPTWQVHNEVGLFQWNPEGYLNVTWDSSRTNSYFYHRLGTILGKDDDFVLSFDLRLKSVEGGVREGKPDAFQIAVGLINFAEAARTNFFRGKGAGTVRSVFEFNYFPDTGFGETVWPAVWSTNGLLSYRDSSDYTLIELPLDSELNIVMSYTAADRVLRTTLLSDGTHLGPINDLILADGFSDFRVDSLAVCSYSDTGNTASIFAEGEIDNLHLTLPPLPVSGLALVPANPGWALRFQSQTNWYYQVESTSLFDEWQASGPQLEGTGDVVTVPVGVDIQQAPFFWRVNALRP